MGHGRVAWLRVALALALALTVADVAMLRAPTEAASPARSLPPEAVHVPGREAGSDGAPEEELDAICAGDEQISFAPAAPYVGQTLLVAVSSGREHLGVWLSGPDF